MMIDGSIQCKRKWRYCKQRLRNLRVLLESGECDWGTEELEKQFLNLVQVVDILNIYDFKFKILQLYPSLSGGYFQRALVGESGMIRT
jgi:hypothetical protein